jgi:hypothetical protein
LEQTNSQRINSARSGLAITERDIQKGLYAHLYFSGWRLFLPNTKFFNWESDFLTFNLDGQIHEFEIKLSRAEFLNDFKKPKHARLKNGRYSDYRIPNFFTFVLPAGFGRRYEIPEYAGLMEWNVQGGTVKVKTIRSAKELSPVRCCERDYEFLISKSNEKMVKAWL